MKKMTALIFVLVLLLAGLLGLRHFQNSTSEGVVKESNHRNESRLQQMGIEEGQEGFYAKRLTTTSPSGQ